MAVGASTISKLCPPSDEIWIPPSARAMGARLPTALVPRPPEFTVNVGMAPDVLADAEAAANVPVANAAAPLAAEKPTVVGDCRLPDLDGIVNGDMVPEAKAPSPSIASPENVAW